MKRLLILLAVSLVLFAGIVTAETRTLIDFSQLGAEKDRVTVGAAADGTGGVVHNAPTLVDFSGQAQGITMPPEERKMMMVSLYLDEWEIELASSSRTVANMENSKTRVVVSKEFGFVLGVRIHFPTSSYNAWAIIKPPFEIPAFARPTTYSEAGGLKDVPQSEMDSANSGKTVDDVGYMNSTSKFEGRGVLKNVQIIKSIKVKVYGTNYPHGLGIRIKNEKDEYRDIFLDYLDHDGWKDIVWENPNYIEDVRDRELRTAPLYPYATPYIKFIGFIIYRDGSKVGGDFVVYFQSVTVTYDKAIQTFERDIDDEGAWKIMEKREEARKTAEERRIGSIQLLRYIEKKKMDAGTAAGADSAAQPK